MMNKDSTSFYNIQLGGSGQVDIGAAQATGTVASVADAGTGKGSWLTLGASQAANFQKNDSINVLGTTNYNDVHNVEEVDVAGNRVRILAAFVSNQSGTWNREAAVGAFVGFIAMTAIPANDITILEIEDKEAVGHWGDPKVVPYQIGQFYMFPGVITKIQLSTGNIRLVRYSRKGGRTIS